jgi:hypothetical protein
VKVLATALATATLASGTVSATLSAPTHAPKIKTKWYYTVRVTVGGKAAAARITAQIVDPIGGTHAVDLGSSTKPITNYAIKGTFRDYIIWPSDSRGIRLTLRITVRAGGTKKIVKYWVVAH